MTGNTDAPQTALNRTIVRIAGLIAAAAGATALLGWALDNPFLKSFYPSFVSMKANTAAAFLLAGISLFLKADAGKRSRIADVCAGAAALIGFLTLCEYVLGVDLRIDQVLFREPHGATLTVIPGRMAPDTATAFFLAGMGLLCLKIEFKKARPAAFLMLMTGFIGFSAILAYILGTATLYGYSRFTGMALPTAMAFVALAIGGLMSNPKREMLSVAASGGIQDKADRRMSHVFTLVFFIMIAVIVIAGCLYCRGYERNYRKDLENRLCAISTLKEGELVEYRKERLGDAAILHKNASITRLVRRVMEKPKDADTRRQLQAWVDKYKDGYQYNQVRLVDAKGATRMSSPAGLPPMSSVVSKRIPEVLRSGKVEFLDFYRNEYDHRVYLGVMVPILDESEGGRPLGVLILRIDPATYLYPFMQSWPTPSRTGETLLVRRDGNDALFLNELKFRKNTALNLRIPLEKKGVPAVKAALGKTGAETGVDYRGEPVAADTHSIPGSPWFLVTKMDLDEANAPLREHLQLVVGFIGILLVCISVCVGFVWQMWKTRLLRERYAAAEELRETNEYLENLFNYANAPIIVWDPQFRITRFNHAFETLTGRNVGDVIGKSLEILFPSELVKSSMELIRNSLRGERLEGVDIKILNLDGSVRTALWNSATIFAQDGKTPVAAIAQGHDITERKRVEAELADHRDHLEKMVNDRTNELARLNAELARKNKELEQVVFVASHDLRSPLVNVQGFSKELGYSLVELAEILKGEGMPPDIREKAARILEKDAPESMKYIMSSIYRMDSLLTGLLKLSRIGRAALNIVKLDMNSVVGGVIESFEFQLKEAGTKVEAADLPPCRGDAIQIGQVFANLIGNALKYLDPGRPGKIMITGEQKDGRAVYCVEDNGIGIAPMHQEIVFEIFHRLNPDAGEGEGLGLTIVRTIIDKHNGNIRLESEPGKGSRVFVSLPCAQKKWKAETKV